MAAEKKIEVDTIEPNDWIELELLDEEGEPVAGAEYIVLLSNGSEIKGKMDENGYAKVNNVIGGSCRVTFPEYENVNVDEDSK